jgi:hypothetical protein
VFFINKSLPFIGMYMYRKSFLNKQQAKRFVVIAAYGQG